MTAAWIIVLLLVAFVSARLFRSTKMWWALMSAIMAGLLVGMLSKEVSKSSKDDSNLTSYTQLISTVANEAIVFPCTQLACVTEAVGRSAIVGYKEDYKAELTDALVSTYIYNRRDSPLIEDDS